MIELAKSAKKASLALMKISHSTRKSILENLANELKINIPFILSLTLVILSLEQG